MMRKIAIIGDVHGRKNWQKIPNLDSYDQVIFMGDYLDPYGGRTSYSETWDAFQAVLDYQKNNPAGRVICLFGNHDQHYLNECHGRGSRHDMYMAERYNLNEVFHELLDKSKLKLAYHIPGTDILCVHAGISHYWYNTHILKKNWDVATREPVISIKPHDPEAVAELARELNQYPHVGSLGFVEGPFDVYGYDRHQGFLWWRCMTEWGEGVQEDDMLEGFTQVMGHTQVRKLLDLKGKNRDVRGVFVDGLGSDWYTELTINEDSTYEFKQIDIEW